MSTTYTTQNTRDLLAVVKLAAQARFLIRHDQALAAGKHVHEAFETLRELKGNAPDSPEYLVAHRPYELIRDELQKAL